MAYSKGYFDLLYVSFKFSVDARFSISYNLFLANPHFECNREIQGSHPGATYDDACGDMHHWRRHGRLQPS
jgi:hypothetical protein